MPLEHYYASMTRTRKMGVPITPRRGRAPHSTADDLIKKQVGNRLAQIRKTFRCKQLQMAEILGVSVSMYKKYEQGVSFPQPIHFRTLAELDVNLHYLLAGTGDMFVSARPHLPIH